MRIKKRLFFSMLLLSLAFIILLFLSGWYLLANRTNMLYRILAVTGAVTLTFIILLTGIGLGGLALILWRERNLPFLRRLGLMAVNLLFPLAMGLGSRLGFSREAIKASFIEINNQLVKLQEFVLQPREILLLAPHCLQWTGCPHKITVDVYNCRRCGRCPIDALHALASKYGVRLAVATGGTLARHFVKHYRPKAVVAIACERDLTSGIQDTRPLPVLGILNLRPYGPCLNTQVNLKQVEEAIKYFLGEQKEALPAASVSPLERPGW
ncbi:MAG: uncharacterized protein PWP65_1923 [Clostridia bacterium]|nr:uncharacterized protein [Clostridia bacterium]